MGKGGKGQALLLKYSVCTMKHREAIKQIHDGVIGDLQYIRAYFNSSGVWARTLARKRVNSNENDS